MNYTITPKIIRSGFDKKHCYVHARAGILPDNIIIMTTQKLLLSGCDIFQPLQTLRSNDGGITWTDPMIDSGFANKHDGTINICCCDFTPGFHKKTGLLLGIGHTARYNRTTLVTSCGRQTSYAVYNTKNKCWNNWKLLKMPNDTKFFNAGAGCSQRFDLPCGDILIPFYFSHNNTKYSSVMRCAFDGEQLIYLTHGSELTADTSGRGLYEPSITNYDGKFYLTMRADNAGYFAVSNDGINFCAPSIWKWDDGKSLSTYNTQQHWVTHSSGLFLVYTRSGANNDHVFRHRAPLFIAQFDTQNLCLIKSTERIVIPERGARLGNFGVTHLSPYETIITANEWMQPIGCEKYGSNNAFFVSKIVWDTKNEYAI